MCYFDECSSLLYRSQHEDIELVEEDEFYLQAPESISKPVSSLSWFFHSLL